ncbi:putative Lipoprotein [uncultured Paludibacter sp.]|nr:putative Lipoprotein [uncultured Paludibacter sp.]
MKLFNKIRHKNNALLLSAMFILMVTIISSCSKDMEGKIYKVSDEQMIDEILESKGDTVSNFLKIIDISGLRGTVHAYGNYTLFAPTNEAVDKYLSDKGLSLNTLSQQDAFDMVKYHLVPDTISTADFEDGRLSAVNFNHFYITTKTVSDDSGLHIEINRQAKILQKDLRGANGYVHIIDHVLYQSPKTIGEVINELPDTYSLWKEAYIASNMQDTIDVAKSASSNGAYTIFIQSNEAFTKANIHNMDELMTELRTKNTSITDDHLLLYNYIAYHLTRGFKYVGQDLMKQSSLNTLVSGEVIVLKRDVKDVLLNEFLIGGVLEEGVPVNRESEYTDLSCADGVMQDIDGNIQIIKRKAYRVYWDITEQPELMSMKNYRKTGTSIDIDNTDLLGITWSKTFTSDKINYYCGGYPTSVGKDNNFVYGDYFRFRISTNTMKWIEFKTPVLVPGTYKVWLSYRALPDNNSQTLRTIFKQTGQDDQIIGVVKTSYNRSPSSYGLSSYNQEFFEKELLDGYRQQMINSSGFYDTANCCQLMGIIQVYTTGEHTLRFEPLYTNNFTTNWDQILFIPIDDDQIWPKQDIAGKYIYSDTPNCEIYPYLDCTTTQP